MMMKSIAGRRLSGGLTRTARAGGRASRSVVTSMSTPLPKEVKTVTPVGGRTFLKLEEVKEETSGGILLPDQAQTKQTQGVVVICDDGLEFKVGQAVVYSKFAGTDVELGGQEHVILKNDDVVGVMPSTDAKDMQPLGNGILLEVDDPDDKTDGGIFMTGAPKEKPLTGKVLAVGPGNKNEEGKVEPLDISVGATVLYNKFSGVDFEANDGTALMVVKDHDILACLSE
mmetsp:Transcript_14571/g.28176  ORF Transcript_14571/g.28176 Transcript_14571/m.28176 type:complete len:228 (+) Transcript_14571:74-757(+)